jgi:hypothetical protein
MFLDGSVRADEGRVKASIAILSRLLDYLQAIPPRWHDNHSAIRGVVFMTSCFVDYELHDVVDSDDLITNE